jgi:hypothetical protein
LETGATFESPLAIVPSTKSNTSRSGHMTFQALPRIFIFAKYRAPRGVTLTGLRTDS